MDTEKTETDVVTETNEGEGESDTITLAKAEWEKHNQTLGSLKRELKDLKKSQEETKETPKQTKSDDALLQRMERIAFKQHNVSHEDDKDLARKTAKKWNMEIEDVLEDEDFQVKLKKQQDSRANVEATSDIKGSAGQASSKSKSDYWIGKNTPPTDEDITANKIPRGELGKIARHFMANKGSGKKFYND